MLMIDLFSGLGGASKVMKERGWEVITVDNNPKFNPDVCIDIREYHYAGSTPDLIWASPPCTDYSKLSLPKSWSCNGGTHKEPDHSLTLATLRILTEVRPKWWVVENVRGAIPYFSTIFGPVQKRCGSRILWGKFPICDPAPGYRKWRLPPSPDRAALRAIIPEQISRALCIACEHQ